MAAIAETVGGNRSLAQKAGLSESQLYRVLSGESSPRLESVMRICDATGVSLNWLAKGIGPMMMDESAIAEAANPYQNGAGAVGGGVDMELLDEALLALIIKGVEQGLDSIRGELPPDKKARLIVLFYRKYAENRAKPDAKEIVEWIKLAV